ncbi:MAG: class I SAM-dependent methyltransferase [Candidatus Doudnabacteria bacterium]|nr:class I SAM-dependent methyltransferase [Candidatus Doudnabacteria bacterium]
MLSVKDPFLYHFETYTHEGRMVGLLKLITKTITLNLPAKPFIIDAGCSVGYSTLDLAEFFPSATVLGIDLSPEAAAYKHGHKFLEAFERSQDASKERILFARGDMFKLDGTIPQADIILMANNILYKLIHEEDIQTDQTTLEEFICSHLTSSVQKLNNGGYLILALGFNTLNWFIVFQKDSSSQISLVAENMNQESGVLSKAGLEAIAKRLSTELSEDHQSFLDIIPHAS